MTSASVDSYRTKLELKVVRTSETSFCNALADLKGFTCEKRQVCDADLERLQSRIATILSKDASCTAASAPSAVAENQRDLREVSNCTLQLTELSSSERVAIQTGSQAGKYPAIDRLLARKQAISKLRVTSFRVRVRERTLRYGLGQHQYLGKQFDGDSIFGSDGKAVMATKYRQWRIMAVVLTRWQMYTVHPAKCHDEQFH
ncbi:hypothetical protein WJX82_003361 [Trebouxia sp. C0006]